MCLLFLFKLIECDWNLSLKHFFFFVGHLPITIRGLNFKFEVFNSVLVSLSLGFELFFCCLKIVILLLFKPSLYLANLFILLRLYFLHLIDKFLLKAFVLTCFLCESFIKGLNGLLCLIKLILVRWESLLLGFKFLSTLSQLLFAFF